MLQMHSQPNLTLKRNMLKVLYEQTTVDVSKSLSKWIWYNNHTMQSNPRNRQEKPQNINSHKTLGTQLK